MTEIFIVALIAIIFGACTVRSIYCYFHTEIGGDVSAIYAILAVFAIFIAFNLD